jgi:hypothetical protein
VRVRREQEREGESRRGAWLVEKRARCCCVVPTRRFFLTHRGTMAPSGGFVRAGRSMDSALVCPPVCPSSVYALALRGRLCISG